MGTETNLWLIRHARVDGPRGVIHGPDAPADTSDAAAFAALKARLPKNAFAVSSPARRTRETAVTLGLDPVIEPAFREQDFGAWTGRRHNDLVAELGDADRSSPKRLACRRGQPALNEAWAHSAPMIVSALQRGTHSCPAPFMIAERSSRRRPVLDGADDRRENGTRDAATGHLADDAADIRRRGGIGKH